MRGGDTMKTMMIFILLFTKISMVGQDSINLRFIEKINTLRSSKDLKLLQYDERLYPVAMKWAKYITNRLNKYPTDSIIINHKRDMLFTHVNYNKRFNEILKRKDVKSVSENLHFIMETDSGVDFVEESFVAWQKSRYHYESMLDTNNNIAFGYYYDKATRRLLSIIVLTEEQKK
jgi:uncharacterized protein YkwD